MAKTNIQIRLNNDEYAALNDLRGLPEDANYLVILADEQENSDYLMSGSSKAFRELRKVIEEDLEEGIAPKENWASLRKVLKLIN